MKGDNTQQGGDHSTNYQAKRITIKNNGLSYADVKAIALEASLKTFEDNFPRLRDEAAKTASNRAIEITQWILNGLVERDSELLKNFSDPAVMIAVLEAQKIYAKSGEKDIGDLLTDLLVDRIGAQGRSMKQIVLDEALDKVSKLAVKHLDSMTICFFLSGSMLNDIRTLEELKENFEKMLIPFYENLSSQERSYRHIAYLGCGELVTIKRYAQHILRDVYFYLFQNGFSKSEFEQESNQSFEEFRSLFIPCLHNSEKWQFNALTENDFLQQLSSISVSDTEKQNLTGLLTRWIKNADDVYKIVLSWNKEHEKLFRTWNDTFMWKLRLTSVGVAIVQAHYKRKTGDSFDLNIWIE